MTDPCNLRRLIIHPDGLGYFNHQGEPMSESSCSNDCAVCAANHKIRDAIDELSRVVDRLVPPPGMVACVVIAHPPMSSLRYLVTVQPIARDRSELRLPVTLSIAGGTPMSVLEPRAVQFFRGALVLVPEARLTRLLPYDDSPTHIQRAMADLINPPVLEVQLSELDFPNVPKQTQASCAS